MQDQNNERFIYYNEEISALTKFIVLLTSFNFLILIATVTTDVNIKNIILYITLIGLFIFIVMVIILFYKLHAHKTYRENIVKCEARIISEILNGDETNLECIRRRYRDCFKK